MKKNDTTPSPPPDMFAQWVIRLPSGYLKFFEGMRPVGLTYIKRSAYVFSDAFLACQVAAVMGGQVEEYENANIETEEMRAG